MVIIRVTGDSISESPDTVKCPCVFVSVVRGLLGFTFKGSWQVMLTWQMEGTDGRMATCILAFVLEMLMGSSFREAVICRSQMLCVSPSTL